MGWRFCAGIDGWMIVGVDSASGDFFAVVFFDRFRCMPRDAALDQRAGVAGTFREIAQARCQLGGGSLCIVWTQSSAWTTLFRVVRTIYG